MRFRRKRKEVRTESDIIKHIERHLAQMSGYSSWSIGVTTDPKESWAGYERPVFWCCWLAETEDAAKRIQEYFVGKGMQRAPGKSGEPAHVFIF